MNAPEFKSPEWLGPEPYDVQTDPGWWDMVYSEYDDWSDMSLCWESENWVGSAYSA